MALKTAECHHLALTQEIKTNNPVTLISGKGIRHIALTHSANLSEWLDSDVDLIEKLEREGMYQHKGWRLLRRNVVAYQGGKTVYDCLAIKITETR